MYCVHIKFFCYTFHILDLSYTFRVIDTLLLVLVYLSPHSNAMLLISYHVFLSFLNHVHILVIGFMFHACINLRSSYGNVCTQRYCIYPKVSSLYETVTYAHVILYPKVSSLYETVTYAR